MADPTSTRTRWPGPAATCLASVVGLYSLAHEVQRTLTDIRLPFLPSGDDALLELNARDVLHGQQLLGPYSRFGWHHPGPAQALVLSLPVRLAGAGAGLPLAAAAWNLGVAGSIVAFLGRRHGWRAAAGGVLAVGVVLSGAPVQVVREPWNPYMVLLPMLLLLVLVGDVVGAALGSLADGDDGRWLEHGPPAAAWALVVGSFAVQTHISTGPTVAVLWLLGGGALLVAGLRRRRRRPQPQRQRGRPAAVAVRSTWLRPTVLSGALVTLVLWSFPLWDAVTRRPSNVGLLLRFFTGGATEPGVGARQAVKMGLLAMTAFPFGFEPNALATDRTRASLIAGVLVLVALGTAACAVVVLRRSAAGAGLLLASAVGGTAAVIGNTRVTGGLFNYLVMWQQALPGGVLAAVGVALARPGGLVPGRPPAGEPLRRVALAASIALLLPAMWLGIDNERYMRRLGPAPTYSKVYVAAATEALSEIMRPEDRRVLLSIVDCTAWPVVAGVAVWLERGGRSVALEGPACAWGRFTTYFGERRVRRGDEGLEVLWALAPAPATPPKALLLVGPRGSTAFGTFSGDGLSIDAGYRYLR